MINWNEASTKRGLINLIGGLVAIYLLIFDSQEKAMAAMAITATVAGSLGVGLKDNGK